MTPEERLQERIHLLGDEAGRFTVHLEDDLSNTRLIWKRYVTLFGTNKERIDLLNECSGIMAWTIERCFRESTILAVCRMTDPKETKRKEKTLKNLSVTRLPEYLKGGAGDQELNDRISAAVTASAFARRMRDKKLAHMDYDTRTGAAPLSDHDMKMVSDAIDAIAACIRRFAYLELDWSLNTHAIEPISNDEVEFLISLYRGHLESQRLNQEERKVYEQQGWQAARALLALPEWLTFRPEFQFDAE